jgi:hypothetical protein
VDADTISRQASIIKNISRFHNNMEDTDKTFRRLEKFGKVFAGDGFARFVLYEENEGSATSADEFVLDKEGLQDLTVVIEDARDRLLRKRDKLIWELAGEIDSPLREEGTD